MTAPTIERIMHISLFTYLFLLIFPHTTTIQEVSFWTAFLCWAILRLRKQESFIPFNPITISFSLFIVIVFTASVIGMDPLENLKRFKGELIVPFILFLIAVTEFSNIEKAKKILLAPLIAFAVYTLLAIIESTNYGLQYFWDKTNREQYIWLTNYTQMAFIILPMMLGIFLFTKNIWVRVFLIIFATVEFIIIASYRSITPFLAVVSVLFLWILFVRPKKYRLWMGVFILLFIFSFGLLLYTQKNNPAIREYSAKFDKISNITREFRNKGGFSNRLPAWKAAIDIIKDRPLLGYGWGIKKFEKLVYQKKFLDKWKESNPSVYEFYTVIIKNSFFPPHNLFLEIAVQSGLFGLMVSLLFIGIYLYYLIKDILTNTFDTDRNFSMILIGGTFLSFIIVNLMSNELGNDAGKIFFVVIGIGAGWIKNKELQHSTHYPIG